MQIYIASSWKNQHAVEMLTDILRGKGHKVISFVENAVRTQDRNNFKFDVDEWIVSKDGQKKFRFDTDGATKSDLVIYIGPSGTDAWAEIGAAWSTKTVVFGLYAKGEATGLMRYMITSWFYDYRKLLDAVEKLETHCRKLLDAALSDAEGIFMNEKQDLTEFRRLRSYYRRNFKNGKSDESFLLWCETMLTKIENNKD